MDIRKILYIITIVAGFVDAFFSYLAFKSMTISEAIDIELNPLVDLLLKLTNNPFIAAFTPVIITIILATIIYKLSFVEPKIYLPLQVIYAYIRVTSALTPFTYLYFPTIFQMLSEILIRTYLILIICYILYIILQSRLT